MPLPPKSAASATSDENSADLSEYLDIDPEFPEISETDDGGVIITLGEDKDQPPEEGGFYENLAAVLPETTLETIATDLLRKIEEDKESRKKRDEKYEEGIRRTGLGDDAPGGAQFEGASRVVHPMLTEGCIDFEARIIKELWPATGDVVKPKITGEVTKSKDERAQRKVDYMNWQLTTQIKEARSVMETTLTQVPLGGSQFVKLWYDHRLKRPRMQFISVDKVFLPFAAASYSSATRRTFADTLDMIEIRQRMDSGQYRKVELGGMGQMPEETGAQKATNKIQGTEDPGTNVDGDRQIYETMAYLVITDEMSEVLAVEEKGQIYPYLITIDETSKKVLSIYRDWEANDETKEPISDLFEFPFIPWSGALSVGLIHIIGSLATAATGALRALLDTAFIENTAGGFILKGSGQSGSTKRPNPTELIEIDRPLETDDIRKMILPHSAMARSSSVLFQLLGFVVQEGMGAVRTSLDDSAIDTNANTPVGTQLSRVEQGMAVFSALHGRIHAAFNSLLLGLHRLNKLYLPDIVKETIKGNTIMVKRADFEDYNDIQPVSDPTIYSDQQRMAQDQALVQLIPLFPDDLKKREILEHMLKRLKIPDYEKFLNDIPEPKELNAVSENLCMVLGQPVEVFPEQDHMAHLKVLFDFLQNPMLGGNPLMAPLFLPAAVKHAVEHLCHLYVEMSVSLVEKAADISISDLMSQDIQVKRQLDDLLATASPMVSNQMMQVLQQYIPPLTQAMQQLQAMQPKPPMDPTAAAIQAAQAETQRKAHADQVNAGLASQKQQQDYTLNSQKLQAAVAEAWAKIQTDQKIAEQNNKTKMAATLADNQTAMDIADKRLDAGQKVNFTDGASLERH